MSRTNEKHLYLFTAKNFVTTAVYGQDLIVKII